MTRSASNAGCSRYPGSLQFRSAYVVLIAWVGQILLFIGSGYAQASDFRKLDEAIAGAFVSELAPVFDFDRDGCLPSAGISRNGEQNKGLRIGGTITGECRSRNFLDTSNTLHRHACTFEGGSQYCANFYALYFEKDQIAHGPNWWSGGYWGHRHDWEFAAIWTKDGTITHGSASAHGDVITRVAGDLAYENGHMKVVYHKDDGNGATHAMRHAGKDERAENPYGRFVTPTLISWVSLHGDGIDNEKMRALLNGYSTLAISGRRSQLIQHAFPVLAGNYDGVWVWG